MTETNLPLPLSFFSIVVLRHAVARSFPGGLPAFELVHQPTRKTPVLCILVRMSWDDVERTLSQLQAVGVIAGEDAAVADMTQGPLLECPGVIFESDGAPFGAQWTVRVTPEMETPVAQPGSLSDDDADEWVTIASRVAEGYAELWDEYLRVRLTPAGLLVDTFRHWPLGDVPDEWLNDDAELVPPYCDADGSLKLPQEIDGRRITSCVSGELFGELIPVTDDGGVQMCDFSSEVVRSALEALWWPLDGADRAEERLQQLGEALSRLTPTPNSPLASVSGGHYPAPIDTQRPEAQPPAPVPHQPPAGDPATPERPKGLTAHQYYQWRSLHAPEEEYD